MTFNSYHKTVKRSGTFKEAKKAMLKLWSKRK